MRLTPLHAEAEVRLAGGNLDALRAAAAKFGLGTDDDAVRRLVFIADHCSPEEYDHARRRAVERAIRRVDDLYADLVRRARHGDRAAKQRLDRFYPSDLLGRRVEPGAEGARRRQEAFRVATGFAGAPRWRWTPSGTIDTHALGRSA